MMGRLNGMIFEGAPVRDPLSISVRLKQNPKQLTLWVSCIGSLNFPNTVLGPGAPSHPTRNFLPPHKAATSSRERHKAASHFPGMPFE